MFKKIASNRSNIFLSAGIPGMLVALVVCILFWQIIRLVSSTDWVDHSDRVIAQVHLVEKEVLDLETGLRGFVITNDNAFLTPFLQSQTAVYASLNKLAELVSDNQVQSQKVQAIRTDVDSWMKFANHIREMNASSSDKSAMIEFIKKENGKAIIDHIRKTAADLLAIELDLRTSRIHSANRFAFRLSAIGALLLLLTLITTVRSVWLRGRWEAQLLENEEKFKALVEGVKDNAIYLLDADGYVLTWNAGAERLKGYRAKEIIGRHFSLFYPPEALQMHEPEHALKEAVEKGHCHREGWRVRKNGERFWAEVLLTPLYYPNGELRGFAKVTRDLSERKRFEAELSRWRHIFENADWGVAASTADTKVFEMLNPGFARMHGYAVDELVGKPVSVVFAPEEREKLPELFSMIHRQGRNVFEAVHIRKDGSRFPALLDVTAVKNSKGEVLYRAGYCQDLTAIKKVEETLHKNAVQQQFLAELSALLSQSLDFEARLEMAAARATRTFADWVIVDLLQENGDVKRLCVKHHDIAKQPLADKMAKEFQASPTSKVSIMESIRTGQPILKGAADLPLLRKGINNERYFGMLEELGIRSWISAPLIARSRKFGAITFIAAERDFDASELEFAKLVADRVAISADNARLYQEAQRAIREREDTVAIVSHDLKNPIAAIKLSVQLLQEAFRKVEDLALSDETVGFLRRKVFRPVDIIGFSADSAEHLISDLLDFAKMQSGTFNVAPQKVYVSELLKYAQKNFQLLAKERNIHFAIEDTALGLQVQCDLQRTAQVFSNLIGNALKFTPRDGSVLVRSQVLRDGRVEFTVTDSGEGIPEDALPHLFDRYWQPAGSKRQGVGLGLSIVKGIVEAQGGKVWVTSRVGHGSTFGFTLAGYPDAEEPLSAISSNS